MGIFDKWFHPKPAQRKTPAGSARPTYESEKSAEIDDKEAQLAKAGEAIAAAGREMDKSRISRMFERPASFSLLLFAGNVEGAVEELLSACKYGILDSRVEVGGLSRVYGSISSRPEGPGNSIVYKGVCVAEGFTILADPEMVVGADIDRIKQFCKQQETVALSIIWERVSETVMAMEYDSTGLIRSTNYSQGKPQELVNPHSQITAESDHRALLQVARDFGLDLGRIGDVSMRVYRLRE